MKDTNQIKINPPPETHNIRNAFYLISFLIFLFGGLEGGLEITLQLYFAFVSTWITLAFLIQESRRIEEEMEKEKATDHLKIAFLEKQKAKEEANKELVVYVEGTTEWEEVFGKTRKPINR